MSESSFPSINAGYNAVFQHGRMSIGLVVPIEHYPNDPMPSMSRHLERVQLVEELGFSAIWLRDVPFNVPSFGDAGQLFDPFTYLGFLAAGTDRITLGVASIILPLRHPAHVAKAAATADVLSGGRVILGIASGDRPQEYPGLNQPFADRGKRFQESYDYIRRMAQSAPNLESPQGTVFGGMDMQPKPMAGKLPLLITGGSQQSDDWIAQHGDGWMLYPRNPVMQQHTIHSYRERVKAAGRPPQPILQPLYIDLVDDPNAQPEPIHLGFRLGINPLKAYLQTLEKIGVNHLALNLRFNRADTETTLKRIANELLPDFFA